jgi:hypothetical protein
MIHLFLASAISSLVCLSCAFVSSAVGDCDLRLIDTCVCVCVCVCLLVSSQYDVQTLVFPLLLTDAIPESLVNDEVCLTRAGVVLRVFKYVIDSLVGCVVSCLSLTIACNRSLLLMLADSTIKNVRLLLPPQTSAEMLVKYEKLLGTIFAIQVKADS